MLWGGSFYIKGWAKDNGNNEAGGENQKGWPLKPHSSRGVHKGTMGEKAWGHSNRITAFRNHGIEVVTVQSRQSSSAGGMVTAGGYFLRFGSEIWVSTGGVPPELHNGEGSRTKAKSYKRWGSSFHEPWFWGGASM